MWTNFCLNDLNIDFCLGDTNIDKKTIECHQNMLYSLKATEKSDVYSMGIMLVELRGANETRQLASHSDSTRSKLDSCELDSSSSSTRNVN